MATLTRRRFVSAAMPAAAASTTAPELLDAMLDAQQERAEGVSDYAMDLTLMNQPSTQYYERTPIEASRGRSLEMFRLVPFAEVQLRLQDEGGLSKKDARARAGATELPSGVLSGMATGDVDIDYTESLAERAEIVRQESLDGRNAHVVRADGLELRQAVDGQEYDVRSITLWVDAQDLVTLKMRMDGFITQDGESRQMFIERLDRDYRNVPGSRMIMPYKTILRMGGMMTAEQQAEMEEASKQLADLERQMASMPPDQRQMMESMMGPQIEMMRKMGDGGVMEFETTVREIRVNQGISGAFAQAGTTPAGGGAGGLGAVMSTAYTGGHAAPAAPAPPERDAASLQQARQACLEQKVAEAEARKKKKKRFGKFFKAVGNIAGRHAGGALGGEIGQVTSDIYAATATVKDVQDAADALGITQDDIAECENPE